jgi:GT2 family glycosyltransferase
VRPRVSVIVVAYRSGLALVRCLESLADDDEVFEVIVVNNGGPAEEIEEAERMPFVRVVDPGRNLGFAGGCNAGARAAQADILLFLNPDTVAAEGAVRELADTLADPSVGIAMARLRLLEAPSLLNSGGNVVHVAGFAWAGGHGEPADTASGLRDVPFASGAALAIRAETFQELGGFTRELFLYGEDLELGWRARLRGLRIVMNPRADVFHDYDFGRNGEKRYYLERNRLVFVLSAFSGKTLAVLAPVLVGAEVATSVLALRERWWREKAAGWGWLLRHAGWVARHRRATQRLRRVPDRELAAYLTATLDPAMVAIPPAVAPLNRLVAAYWRLAQRAL